MRNVLLALVFVVLAAPALAADGVLEVNQTCAVNTGCLSGDTAGYPVTIDGTAGRGYRLTSDLIVPNENTDGIKVSTSDIGIDLNNFAIIRSGCEGVSKDCTPVSGTGSGIEYGSSLNRGISVKNGSITGMGSYGVLLGIQAEVTGLRVRWNRVIGIYADAGSIVSGNTVYQNGDDGIFASNGSTISGNTAYLNAGDRIATSSGVTVQRNTVSFNLRYGLNLGSQSAYRENVITGNATGTVTGGTNAGANVCNGSLTCP